MLHGRLFALGRLGANRIMHILSAINYWFLQPDKANQVNKK